ncbi:MAG: fructosamine kinase family protein [Halothiobacillaceae bacterium]|nr:fructosamine kinase family protein [Halothiobacillaceae bacterium]
MNAATAPDPLYADIAERISQVTGEPFRARHPHTRSGGGISESLVLEDGARMFFIKLNRAERLPMFEAEMAGLRLLAATQTLRVPEPLLCGTASASGQQHAFIVLEYLPLVDSDAPERLAEQLVALHQHSGAPKHELFGLQHDNFIGTTPQDNTPHNDWVSFWSRCRLQPQLERARQNQLAPATLELGEQLLAALPSFFTDYQPRPSALHGDLWGGNYGYVASESAQPEPVIFDPATYFGDREADIAMTELFGGFPPRFRHAYEAAWPLDAGYGVRRQLYNLYHVLNHFNLFGEGYAAQSQRLMQRLLSEVRA